MYLITPVADADVPHADAVVGAQNTRITQRRRAGGGDKSPS